MQGLRHMLLQEQKHLQEIADKARTGLTTVPEGNLRISKDKNKPRYYQCIDDNNGIYIPRSNKELPKLLAQKTYNRIVVKKVEARLKQIPWLWTVDDHHIEIVQAHFFECFINSLFCIFICFVLCCNF